MNNQPFISVNNVTIRNTDSFFFENTSWILRKNEQWLIYGRNGSGKSTFVKAIAGLLPIKRGEIILNFANKSKFPFPSVHKSKIAYLSFETQQNFLNKDSLKRDFESYMGIESSGSLVRDYLGFDIDMSYAKLFSIKSLLDHEIATLSTGEMRKVFILKSLMQKPELLILDEPFDGLDLKSKENFMEIVNGLIAKGLHVILIVHRIHEIPKNITHILLVKNCKVFAKGSKDQIKKQFPGEFEIKSDIKSNQGKDYSEKIIKAANQKKDINFSQNNPLITMSNVTVRFGEKIILDHINWSCNKGENWVIIGHNGAGKSTLVKLILGDQLQAYANDITVFGKKKDTGISIWEIKEKIGVVSTDLMIKYNKQMSAHEVILSGFFDSIGLYKTASIQQKEQAYKWTKALNIQNLAKKNYNQLSFGQKRLILIARAVVKSPQLLILDEPCHGLDSKNRESVLEIINIIGNSRKTNIIMITHDQNDIIPCITNLMVLEKGKIKKLVRI